MYSTQKKQITVSLAMLLVVCFLVAFPVNALAADPYIVDPATITTAFDDDLNAYDAMPKHNYPGYDHQFTYVYGHSTFSAERLGAYVRGSEDIHRYYAPRIPQTANQLPMNVFTMLAEPGITFNIFNADFVLLASEVGIAPGQASQFNASRISTMSDGQKVYYYDFKGASATRLWIEIGTPTDNDLHYSFWYQYPLLAQSRAKMIVYNNTVFKPATSSTQVSATFSAATVPERSWAKSIAYTINSQVGEYNVASYDYLIQLPNFNNNVAYKLSQKNTPYAIQFSEQTAYSARNTFKHNLSNIKWQTSSGSGTFSLNANFFLEYYYAFGSCDTPVYQ